MHPRFTAFAISENSLYHQPDNEHRIMIAYYLGSGKIIGYYSLVLQEDKHCELNNLCVLPGYRHNNIGAALLEDVFRRSEELGCEKINIGIAEENKVLRKWYESSGFIHTGTRKIDFYDPEKSPGAVQIRFGAELLFFFSIRSFDQI